MPLIEAEGQAEQGAHRVETGEDESVHEAREHARRRSAQRLQNFELYPARQHRRSHVDSHHRHERERCGDARDDQKLRAPDVQVLSHELSRAEEEAIGEYIEGEYAPALRVGHERVEPALDDDGETRSVQSDQEPEYARWVTPSAKRKARIATAFIPAKAA